MSKPRVALLGLGVMGGGMAHNLLRAGFPLSVYNRNATKAEPFAAAGARVAPSPADAATGADVVIAMVADDTASRAVWLGDSGALAALAPGAIVVESSTVTPEWVRELAATAQARGVEAIDAPVTGSKPQAAAGELLFLVGGPAETLERARPVLAAMSRAIVHVGPSGSGAVLKLVNNFLCGIQATALAEGLAFVERAGIDRATALEVLTTGAPGSPLVKAVSGRMTARAYTPPNFMLRLLAKDLDYARKEAARYGLALETVAPALDLMGRAIATGHADEDFAAIVEPLREGA